MKCINNKQENSRNHEEQTLARLILTIIGLVIILGLLLYILLIRMGDLSFEDSFNKNHAAFGIRKTAMENDRAASFASDLCVSAVDVPMDGLNIAADTAALFNEADKTVEYAKGLHEKRYPASLTKIMTTLVALKYGNLSDLVTVGSECKNIEMGSSVCEIHEGDQLTLEQLLYGLMINSGNDAAMSIAVHVGGSVENFVKMMNDEARKIGAEHTHFMNPHGLQDEEHYTTAYDIYLMFHEALKYDVFQDIISKHSYYASFLNAAGEETGVMWESTNHYFINEAVPPSDVVVFGGKTGTTSAAGACLCLYSKNKYGDPYVSIIMKSESKDTLYEQMNELLSKINK